MSNRGGKTVGNIYYLIPDLFKPNRDFFPFLKACVKKKAVEHFAKYWFPKHRPVGGIKVMYQHCLLLQELGFNAFPLLMGKYDGNFFGYNIEVKHLGDVGFQLGSNDVLVCPELFPYEGLNFEVGTRVVFVQNWPQLYDHRFKIEDGGKSYSEMGYNFVMYCGDYLREKLHRETEDALVKISNFIDHTVFVPNVQVRKNKTILALYRKRKDIIDKVAEILKAHGVTIKLVEGLTQDQIIAEYQAADIFFAAGYPEGFGLPPLEAMCCGAAVVGFTGGGASEFMIDNVTALVADDGDYAAVADKILKLLNDSCLKEKIRRGGQDIARKYASELTKKQLQEFYGSISTEK